MQGAGQGSLRLNVAHTRQLDVEVAELVPVVFPCHPDKGGEVVRCIVAHVLVIRLHRGVDEEVGDLVVNRRHILQSSDERTNVLEGSTSHNLRRWVKQEPMVKLLNGLRVPIHWGHFGDLGDDISACLPHFPLLVLGQMVIEREEAR